MNKVLYIILYKIILFKNVYAGNTYDPAPKISNEHNENGYIFKIEATTPPQYSFFQLKTNIINYNNTICSDKWIKSNFNGKTIFTLDITYQEIEKCKPRETINDILITQELDIILTLRDNNVDTDFKHYYWHWFNYIDRSTMISSNIKMLANEEHMLDIGVNSTIDTNINFCNDLSCLEEYNGNFYHGQEIIIKHYFTSKVQKYIKPISVWLETTTKSKLDLSHTIVILEKSINNCKFKVRLSTCVDCTIYIMSIIQNTLNRFRRLNNDSSFISSREITVHHNYSSIKEIYNNDNDDNLEKKLEDSLKVSNIMIVILSLVLVLVLIYVLINKNICKYSKNNCNNICKYCKKKVIIPINNNNNELEYKSKTITSNKINNVNTSINYNEVKLSAPSITSSLSLKSSSLRRIKSDSDIETNPRSPKNNSLSINEKIRDTISEPPDNSEYMDDVIRKDFIISGRSNNNLSNNNMNNN